MNASFLLSALVLVAQAPETGKGASSNPSEAARPSSELIRNLDARVLTTANPGWADPSGMLARDTRRRLEEASLRESRAYAAIASREDWEAFRKPRLDALRRAIGLQDGPTTPRRSWVTRVIDGDGFRIENRVFLGEHGLPVTGNLYLPATPKGRMPLILIVHSHHNPKSQGELQDMGMTWARAGCAVSVIDQLGHGERRQHPFRSEADFARTYRVGRQDYYFRHVSALQLEVAGESLLGWMVADLRAVLDLMLARPDIDSRRVIVLGSVAGGGDPAGVFAALDQRVAAVVPFNFGGSQPDYAVPADPDRRFHWFGVPSWESTRALRGGASGGFAQWMIVASMAPRALILAHEFAWNRDADPAWPRIQRVFDLYGAEDRLATATGQGNLRGTPPESSHCNNIGALHRSRIHPTLERWFGMKIPVEYSQRRPATDLDCLNEEVRKEIGSRPLHDVAAAIGRVRSERATARLAALAPIARRESLREAWGRLLGDVRPEAAPELLRRSSSRSGDALVERLALEVEPGIVIPALFLRPLANTSGRLPVVVGVAQGGKAGFLERRSEEVSRLLAGGCQVCLVDVRGTGETRLADGSRRHGSASTTQSAAGWVLGQPLLGSRLRDLRSILAYLRGREEVDPHRIGLWGDSMAPTNTGNQDLAVPLEIDPYPTLGEPLGGLLALLGALFDGRIAAVAIRGGLVDHASMLASPFVYLPHDAIVPGALGTGDLSVLAAVLDTCPIRLEAMIDGLNRPVAPERARREVDRALQSLGIHESKHIEFEAGDTPAVSWSAWLLRGLGRR